MPNDFHVTPVNAATEIDVGRVREVRTVIHGS
jgi:hypothetical protein